MPTTRTPHHRLSIVPGALGWLLFAFMTAYALTVGWRLTTGDVWQVDWHVYVAGALDLLAGQLYERPLELGDLTLSTSEYNLPPLSAVWAIPLLPMSIQAGGVLWQLLGAASIAIAAALAGIVLELRRPFVWAGIALGLVSVSLIYLEGLHLGTNNYLMLAMVAGFVWRYRLGSDRTAGLLLGLAISTKGWPIALVVPLIRERRWKVLAWAAGVVIVQGLVFLAWLGPELLGDLGRAMQVTVPPTGYLIGPSAIDWARPVWNSGLGWIVAAGLLALPVRGRLGLGIAILAGLAPIANLWLHYAPTVLFAVALTLPSAWQTLRRRLPLSPPGAPVPKSGPRGA